MSLTPKSNNRWLAGGVHLVITTIVALLVLALVFLVWYPKPMATAQGVSHILLILIGVDVILGPVVTTTIWNPSKGKWLYFDLSIIATVQILALAYGVYSIHGGRPVYLVFNIDRFEVTAHQEIDRASYERAHPSMQLSLWGYKTVSARLPRDAGEQEDLLFSSLSGGPDLRQLPHLFLPLEAERDTMIQKAHPIRELQTTNSLSDTEWSAFVGRFDRPEATLGYLPMRANQSDGVVILDTRTGKPLGIHLLSHSSR